MQFKIILIFSIERIIQSYGNIMPEPNIEDAIAGKLWDLLLPALAHLNYTSSTEVQKCYQELIQVVSENEYLNYINMMNDTRRCNKNLLKVSSHYSFIIEGLNSFEIALKESDIKEMEKTKTDIGKVFNRILLLLNDAEQECHDPEKIDIISNECDSQATECTINVLNKIFEWDPKQKGNRHAAEVLEFIFSKKLDILLT